LIQRINLYLFRQILIAFLFSAVAVTFVVLFTQSFRLLSFVIDNSGSLFVFLKLMALTIPSFLPLILPISMGVAVLFIYHKFAVDSELVVMRAAGFSPLKLAAPAITLAGITVVVGLLLTLWVTPLANASFASLQYKVRDAYSALMIRPGTFNDLSEGLTFFARRRAANGGLEDILVHDVRSPDHPVTIMAETGLFAVEDGVPQVIVFSGKRQEVDVKTGRLQQLDFDRYVLDLHLLKSGKTDHAKDPREMSFVRLLTAQADPKTGAKLLSKIRTEIHQRVAGPLLSLTFALVSVTVILVGNFNRRGMAKRVLLASLFIIILQAAMFGLVAQVGTSPWTAILLYLALIAPLPPCLYLLNLKTLCQWPSPKFMLQKAAS